MVRRPRQEGFTLVGLLIAVAIVNLTMAMVATSWVHRDHRAREAELLWRGQQIARALACWSQGNAGEALVRLEQLVEADCLRRVYRDPMAANGQWRILTGQDVADGTVAALLGTLPEPDSGESGPQQAGVRRSGLQIGPGRAGGNIAGAAAAGADTIVGVVSTSTKAGLRLFRGRSRYSEWVFLAPGTS